MQPETANPVKQKRRPPKTKKKFGRHLRKGGVRKCRAAAPPVPDPQVAPQADTHAASIAPASNPTSKKQTKSELIKAAGYVEREARTSKRKADFLKEHVNAQELEHTRSVALITSALQTKSKECNNLAALAQQHRKAANMTKHQADTKVEEMIQESRVLCQEADAKVTEAESGALSTIRAERAHQQAKVLAIKEAPEGNRSDDPER